MTRRHVIIVGDLARSSMVVVVLVGMWLCGLATFTTRPADAATAGVSAPGSVTGVVASGTDVPLANMCVTLWQGSAALRAACTDATGTFTMPAVAVGDYTVSYFDPTGIRPTVWLGGTPTQGASTVLSVATGDVADASVAMGYASNSVSGQVHFAAGDPSKAACVYLYAPGAAGPFAGHGTCTNPEGYYVLGGVADGSYVVAFTDPDGVAATTWSGGVTSQADAVPVTVGPTPATGVDVTMAAQADTVSGRILGSDAEPLTQLCFYAFNFRSGSENPFADSAAATCTNADGFFNLDLSKAAWGQVQIAVVDQTETYPVEWIAPNSSGDGYRMVKLPRYSGPPVLVPVAGAFVALTMT